LSSHIPDKDYNLISILYHSLSGADSCRTYIQDAEGANDSEAADFFKETKEQYEKLAQKAKKLAASRIG